MHLSDLVRDFGRAPQSWQEGRTIPWDDPGFSVRMLQQHLSQAHDGASRRQELIDRHVKFIVRAALTMSPSRVLDLGCGPGFYTHRLAALGHDCLGIDFAPAAIDYAQAEAQRKNLTCRFVLADIQTANFGRDNDLVMLLFGELNLFPRDQAIELLKRCTEALTTAGKVLLEVHSHEAVKTRGIAGPKWSAVEAGLFADEPHLRLEESFWLDDSQCAAGRYWLVDAATSAVRRYGWTMQAYTDEEYKALLTEAGLRLERSAPNLEGTSELGDFPVLIASRL